MSEVTCFMLRKLTAQQLWDTLSDEITSIDMLMLLYLMR